MAVFVKPIEKLEKEQWDRFVDSHPEASFTHLSGCSKAIRKYYGLNSFCLAAFQGNEQTIRQASHTLDKKLSMTGLLPLVHMRHFLFGNQLVSMPFFDTGGILADDADAAGALIDATLKLASQLKVPQIELRMTGQNQNLISGNQPNETDLSRVSTNKYSCRIFSEKVRMILDLPENADELMKSFKSKLRSQVRKPLRDGLVYKSGGIELLNDFYHIFSTNMRDLGSPVHAKSFINGFLTELGTRASIILVSHNKVPLAGSIVVGFGKTLYNPWASALRSHKRLNPNMLLYWAMLEYACTHGFEQFDFGRSTPGEGTYRFKEQWGAKPTPLHWRVYSQGAMNKEPAGSTRSRFDTATRYWQKLPLPLSRILGPMVRKHISL